MVAPDDAYRLPDRHYRLVVLVAGVRLDPARILQRGGIAAVADTGVVARSPELRLVAVEDSSLPVLADRPPGALGAVLLLGLRLDAQDATDDALARLGPVKAMPMMIRMTKLIMPTPMALR